MANESKPEVAVVMGSASDWETMKRACDILDQFGVVYHKQVISAHRTPELMAEFAHNARANGLKAIIAGAGGAAHLPGMIAAQRSAAEQAGVAFWNTFDAMGGHNSMVRFVEKHWAAKDYTHIGYTGGKYVADRLVDALITGVDSMRREIELRERIDRLLKYDSAAIDFRVPDTALPLQPSL